jgi:putative nucleotidyltransferase with HDIG domain
MLKRIEVNQVRTGMFVEAIEGAWQDAFLQKRRFFLRREADTQKIRRSGAEQVVINTAKGIDVNGSAHSDANDPAKAAADSRAARKTIEQSTQVLERVFDQIQSGGTVGVDDVAPVISGISDSIDRNPTVFLSVTRLKSKDQVTFQHSLSVSALMIHFARYLDYDEATVRLLGMAGILHDVGKLDIPAEILNKEGRLEANEIEMIRAHPALGHSILSLQEGMPEIVLDVCLNHHERMDGRGYPNMLPASAISRYSRIATICDVYDAITSIRPYKKPWTPAEALKWMLQSDGHFDRKLLKKFALCLIASSRGAA